LTPLVATTTTKTKTKTGTTVIGPTGTFFLESGTAANPSGPPAPGGNIVQLVPIATGSQITIQTLTGGDITQEAALGNPVATTGTKIVTLFTGGIVNSGSILQALPPLSTVAPTLGAAGGVNLTSSHGGSILGPLGGAFLINSPSVTANSFFAPTAVAPVNLKNVSTLPTTIGNSGGENFSLATSAATTLNYINAFGGAGIGTGNIFLVATTGSSTTPFQTAAGTTTTPGSVITATNGAITVENATLSGKILLGTNSVIRTLGMFGGAVNVIIGPLAPPVAGSPPATFFQQNLVGTGTIAYGTNGITSLGPPVNTVNAINAQVQFSTGTAPATAITLNGGVIITADPPAPSGVLSAPAITTTVPMPASLTQPPGTTAGLPATTSVGSWSGSQASRSSLGAEPVAQQRSLDAPALTSVLNVAHANQLAGNMAASLLAMQSTIPNRVANILAGAGRWISDTELVTGEIPAVISSDEELGVVAGESTVADLETAAPAGPQATASTTAGGPLAGAVAKNVGSGRLMTLKRGTVLFVPSVDTMITTPFGKIKIDAKSLVLVMSFANGVAVYDLDDLHAGAVRITAAGSTLSLSPGRHAVITPDSVKAFEQVNPAQLIGYRNITSHRLGAGIKAFTAEFSVPCAVSAVLPLKQLMNCTHPNARRVTGHMLKTAAVVMQMNSASGTYQQVFRPQTTAWLP